MLLKVKEGGPGRTECAPRGPGSWSLGRSGAPRAPGVHLRLLPTRPPRPPEHRQRCHWDTRWQMPLHQTLVEATEVSQARRRGRGESPRSRCSHPRSPQEGVSFICIINSPLIWTLKRINSLIWGGGRWRLLAAGFQGKILANETLAQHISGARLLRSWLCNPGAGDARVDGG